MIIIGITGTIGAGKGTVVEYLVEKKAFKHYSVRSFLIEEIENRGLVVNRDSMVLVANDLRRLNGPAYIVEQLYEQAKMNNKDAVIESIRTPGEIDMLEAQKNFFLLAVDADPQIRYERVILRNSATDNIDFETFLENEKREMTAGDVHKQNLSQCIKRASHIIFNNNRLEQLYAQIDAFYNNFILKK